MHPLPQFIPLVVDTLLLWIALAGFQGFLALMFTDAAVKEIARIALERGTGARGLRSVSEEVLEGVLFEVAAGVRYAVTEVKVRAGEAVRRKLSQSKAPLSSRVCRRLRGTSAT